MTRYIVFADDDADDLELITGFFKQFDPHIHVFEFRDGSEVLKFLEEFALQTALPLLIVLDVNMPRLDGKSTLMAIRNDQRFQHIPVLLYSTSSGKTEQDFCRQYTTTWISKPSDVQEVKSVARVMADFCLLYKAS